MVLLDHARCVRAANEHSADIIRPRSSRTVHGKKYVLALPVRGLRGIFLRSVCEGPTAIERIRLFHLYEPSAPADP